MRFGPAGTLYMNKFFRFSLFSIGIALVFSTVSVAEGRGQDVLREILKRLDTNNRSIQSLHADVEMVKMNTQLNVADTSTGSTSYLPKNSKHVMYIRLDWTRPVEEQMSVIGDDYELYRPRLNQVIVGKVQKAQGRQGVGNALGFMNMSKAQLEANYDTAFLGVEQIKGGVQTWHVLLTPKGATSYKSADLWVDADGMPRQARITEQNSDTTTVLLTNIQKNVTLKGEIFKLSYPKTAKKIKA